MKFFILDNEELMKILHLPTSQTVDGLCHRSEFIAPWTLKRISDLYSIALRSSSEVCLSVYTPIGEGICLLDLLLEETINSERVNKLLTLRVSA